MGFFSRKREDENPLPRITYLEQAEQFQVEVIGPLGKTTIASIMRDKDFDKGKEWTKQLPNGEYLEAKSFFRDSEKYILIFNATKLGLWRARWKKTLHPGQPEQAKPK